VEVANQKATLEADIHDKFRRLHEILEVRRTELIHQLHELTQVKLKRLGAQWEQIETTQAQLSSCLDFIKEGLRSGSQREALLMKDTMVKQVKELTTTFQQDILKPTVQSDLQFLAPGDTASLCQNYGQIFCSSLPDPSKCHATGKGVEVAFVGGKCTATLQAVNFKGEPCEEDIRSLTCELMSELIGTRTDCSVKRTGQSQYKISYQPSVKGKHQLHIKVEDQHIRGSPFSVAVKSPVEKLGTPILTIGGVKEPWGVAINQKRKVVVTDRGEHCVSVFSPSGETVTY